MFATSGRIYATMKFAGSQKRITEGLPNTLIELQADIRPPKGSYMTSFSIEMSGPFRPGSFTGGIGGPNQGGHQPPNWYIQFGMDLGATAGTEVRAVFDAHITRLTPHNPASDSGRVYGAQLFMRAPNDMMGGFYTHITNLAPGLAVGSWVSRGDTLGEVVSFDGIPAHLHLALVEIIGGLPGGHYEGVDLYQFFLDSADSDIPATVAFMQDGSPPNLKVRERRLYRD